MEKYDYRAAVKADILDYLNDSDICPNDYTRDELAQKLYDDLFCEDSVTGNGSGSYTFSRWQSEANLCYNWDLIADACREFCINAEQLGKLTPCGMDVTIRCYLLGECIAEALNEWLPNEDEANE